MVFKIKRKDQKNHGVLKPFGNLANEAARMAVSFPSEAPPNFCN